MGQDVTQPAIALVAEKNPHLGEAITDSLELLGFEPIIVSSEPAAVVVLAEVGEPDLLICDANFGAEPKSYAYVRATLSAAPDLPVVIASTPEKPIPADLKGRIAIAEKPFGREQLIEGVVLAKKLVEAPKSKGGM